MKEIILNISAQKKSGHPTQPGNRSNAPKQTKQKKRRNIILLIFRFFNSKKFLTFLSVVLVAATVFCVMHWIFVRNAPESTPAPIPDPVPAPPQEYVFRDGDGSPVDVQSMTSAWAAEAELEKRYDLTDAERWEVASVVTAEALGEPYAGKVAVAQCILQACEDDGIRPSEALIEYAYTKNRPEPTEEALEAVQAVFDFGQVASADPIKYFYAPELTQSEWHESQEYIMTINGHRFFAEKE